MSAREAALRVIIATAEQALRNERRVFTIPGPGDVKRVRFEDKDGGSSSAVLVEDGLYRGLWAARGGHYSWVELLTNFEPLEAA